MLPFNNTQLNGLLHLHAHHQKLETILVLLPHMVCNVLVVGGRRSGAGQQAKRPSWREAA